MSAWMKLLVTAGSVLAVLSAQGAELTVSAAASLTNAFKEIGLAYEIRYPETRVLLNFAASDALLAQISKGAPVDVFASADQDAMDKAQAQQLIVTGTRTNFVGNTLVVITPSDSTLVLKTLADLQQAGIRRIALGNPAGVPFGRYARRALDAQALWPMLEGKAIYAQNVRQALDYVARGEVDAGFVYVTDAAIQKDKVRVAFAVPSEPPITYPVGIISGSPHTVEAARFIAYLHAPTGQAILAKYGFLRP